MVLRKVKTATSAHLYQESIFDSHDFGVFTGAKVHKLTVHQSNVLEDNQNSRQPEHQNTDGDTLVIKQYIQPGKKPIDIGTHMHLIQPNTQNNNSYVSFTLWSVYSMKERI